MIFQYTTDREVKELAATTQGMGAPPTPAQKKLRPASREDLGPVRPRGGLCKDRISSIKANLPSKLFQIFS